MRRALILALALSGCRAFTGEIPCAADDNCPRQLPFCVEGNCELEPVPAPAPDAGGDAGPVLDAGPAEDAGPARDAGVDAGPDAGADAGPAPDAGADAGPGPGLAVDHLVINEIDYDQNGADNEEFVELYNPWCEPLSLVGLSLDFLNGNLSPPASYMTVDLSSAASLAPGAFLVVADSALEDDVSGAAFLPLPNAIENGHPDLVTLVDTGAGVLVDGLVYGPPVDQTFTTVGVTASLDTQSSAPTTDDNGIDNLALIRFPDGADTDFSDVDWRGTRRPTPGAPNEVHPTFADSTPGTCADADGAPAICADLVGALATQDGAVSGPPFDRAVVGVEVVDARTSLRFTQQRPALAGSASSAALDCGLDRLPTRYELVTALDYGAPDVLDPALFPEHPNAEERTNNLSINLWTSTADPGDATRRYVIEVPEGRVRIVAEDEVHFTLCVDGGLVDRREYYFPSIPPSGAPSGTLIDERTGLEWADQIDTGDFDDGLLACAALEQPLGVYDDWRLPSARELLSAFDDVNSFGSVWTFFFTDTNAEVFLSSTPVFGDAQGRVWGVDFTDGTTVKLLPTQIARVRCVRGP